MYNITEEKVYKIVVERRGLGGLTPAYGVRLPQICAIDFYPFLKAYPAIGFITAFSEYGYALSAFKCLSFGVRTGHELWEADADVIPPEVMKGARLLRFADISDTAVIRFWRAAFPYWLEHGRYPDGLIGRLMSPPAGTVFCTSLTLTDRLL